MSYKLREMQIPLLCDSLLNTKIKEGLGKKESVWVGKISNMFDFSHGPNRQLPTLTECLGLSKFLKPTPKNP